MHAKSFQFKSRLCRYLLVFFVLGFSSCDRWSRGKYQGYTEGEFVYPSSPVGGRLEELLVRRGAEVKKGDVLGVLEAEPEQSQLEDLQAKVEQAKYQVADFQKGKRPEEVQAIEAQVDEVAAAIVLAQSQFKRRLVLKQSKAEPEESVEQAQAQLDQQQARRASLNAQLAVAHLGARDDQISSAQEALKSVEAQLAQVVWRINNKTIKAPADGVIADTLYRVGENVAANSPLVMFLPDDALLVKFFVSQTVVSRVEKGKQVEVFVDGMSAPNLATIEYIAPYVEYTPPVIYSQENREKFVVLVEARFSAQVARGLKAGMPVDVMVLAK